MFNMKQLNEYIELYLNGNNIGGIVEPLNDYSAYEQFICNTAKRLMVIYDKYSQGEVSKDVYLCSLRNYLLVCQNELRIKNDEYLLDNKYGILKNSFGKYYASLELPQYLDEEFVGQAFQRKILNDENKREANVFYGTNRFIYELTGYKCFKSLEQKLAVFGALKTPGGYTTLVALPTGGGKSLITQTMAYQEEGLTIVIVPTVSLVIDQVRNAKKNIKHDTSKEIFGYYGKMKENQKKDVFEALKKETAKLLFISPEALIRNNELKTIIKNANDSRYLKNLIIDEAHIVIEWGDFFRVDYQCLEAWRNELILLNNQLKTILLSATYTRDTVNNLRQMFSKSDKWIEIRCDALRHEPRYIVVKTNNQEEKDYKMIEMVKKLPHPMIIYVNSPDEAEETKKKLNEHGFDLLETFTGNTNSDERERIIKDWTDNKIDLIVATSAFGVGVDKPDVRTVMHLYIPDTPDQYYQELGRGGRDGLVSLSVMCINPVHDVDAAFKRMTTVLLPDTMWRRWISMYKSPSSTWYKGKVILDTAIKPIKSLKDLDNVKYEIASKLDIKWNVNVILLFRRYNLLSIKSMVYDAKSESYKIHVEILDDVLRKETEIIPDTIIRIRDMETARFDKGIRRIINSINYNGKICWSEMFYSTYDKVSEYCGGCARHHNIESMENSRFPLLQPIKRPVAPTTSLLDKIYQYQDEIIVMGDVYDSTLLNIFLKSGVSVIVLNDTDIEKNFSLLLNIEKKSDIMIIGLKEYIELSKKTATYYISGGVVALYNHSKTSQYEFCITIQKYKHSNMKLAHIMQDDFYIPEIQKTISSIILGPKIDSYILERM